MKPEALELLEIKLDLKMMEEIQKEEVVILKEEEIQVRVTLWMGMEIQKEEKMETSNNSTTPLDSGKTNTGQSFGGTCQMVSNSQKLSSIRI